jgi:hypothetical protein
MLSKLSNTLHSWATGWLILVLLLANIVNSIYLVAPAEERLREASGGTGLIDTEVGYTPGKAYQMVEAYGENGRAIYRTNIFAVDIILPVLYVSFLALAISWLFKRGFSPASKLQLLNVTPVGAGLFDLLENVGIFSMLAVYPSTPAVLAWISTSFTTIKFVLAMASFALLLVGIVAAILAGARQMFKKK